MLSSVTMGHNSRAASFFSSHRSMVSRTLPAPRDTPRVTARQSVRYRLSNACGRRPKTPTWPFFHTAMHLCRMVTHPANFSWDADSTPGFPLLQLHCSQRPRTMEWFEVKKQPARRSSATTTTNVTLFVRRQRSILATGFTSATSIAQVLSWTSTPVPDHTWSRLIRARYGVTTDTWQCQAPQIRLARQCGQQPRYQCLQRMEAHPKHCRPRRVALNQHPVPATAEGILRHQLD